MPCQGPNPTEMLRWELDTATFAACEDFDYNQTNQLLGACTSAFLENLNAGFI